MPNMDEMDSTWIDRVGLMVSGLAALSFLPAVIGEARLLSFGEGARQFRLRARKRLEALSYSLGFYLLFSLYVACMFATILVVSTLDPESERTLNIGLGIAIGLAVMSLALYHVDSCRNLPDINGVTVNRRLYVMLMRRLYALLNLALGINWAFVVLLYHFTPPPIESTTLRFLLHVLLPIAFMFILGYSAGLWSYKVASTRSLGVMLDFLYKWVLHPIIVLPALGVWHSLRFIIEVGGKAVLGGSLWVSSSRNIQILALIAFLVGVSLQLLATF